MAFAYALSSIWRAAAREVTRSRAWESFSKSRSKPSLRPAPSMNQSSVCAACATCCATVIIPSWGRKLESASSRTLVERSKNCLLARSWLVNADCCGFGLIGQNIARRFKKREAETPAAPAAIRRGLGCVEADIEGDSSDETG